MDILTTKEVEEVFKKYPEDIRRQLLKLRQLIIDTAAEINEIQVIEETLKWGQPGYLTKTGSTIRIDWKESQPDQLGMYFHCKTKLIDTFKELYPDKFQFEGNRAIMFKVNQDIPVNELRHCISLSLNYHNIKHLPMLGT